MFTSGFLCQQGALQRPHKLHIQPLRLVKNTTKSVFSINHNHANLTTCSYRNNGNNRDNPNRRPAQFGTKQLIELAIPTVALLAAASVLAPMMVGFVMAAVTVGISIAAAAAAFSLAPVFLTFLLPGLGIPILVAGGIGLGLFAIPALFQLAFLAAGLGIGAFFFNRLLPGVLPTNEQKSDGTIDVESFETVEDWVSDMEKEAKRREQELKDFDEMLKRRERFKKGDY